MTITPRLRLLSLVRQAPILAINGLFPLTNTIQLQEPPTFIIQVL
jgi:hypothetical protein